MRKLLLAAAATAPLALALGTPAAAQTTISTSMGPVATSTAASGTPSDLIIGSTATITPTATAAGVTLDSNNSITNQGSIAADNVDNAVGALLLGGHTGNFTSTGGISITEDFVATDSVNGDGLLEAPFASGTGRYGVRLTGDAPLVGAISVTGATVVKGNNSYGVSLEAPVTGAVTLTGGVTITGDNTVGIQETGGVTGTVQIGGPITSLGQNARGVVIGGDVANTGGAGGHVIFGSTLSDTGYTVTTRETDAAQQKVQATATDIEQSGAAVTVSANVAGGVEITAPPVGTIAGSLADVDGDGVADGSEATATISAFGSAPALLIGAAGKSIELGEFLPGSPQAAFGLLLRGTVAANGLDDGVAATAVQIGVGDPNAKVLLDGGASITGAVTATAYEANATAVHLMSGAVVPDIVVGGVVTSSILDSTLTTTNTSTAISTAILGDAGVMLGALTNTGTIGATANGDGLSTAAVVDRSGTLSNVLNEGVISAVVTPNKAGDVLTGGRAVALDLSANTSGVTLLQTTNPNPNVTFGSTSGTTDVSVTTVTAVTPQIIGDVLLGDGANSVDIEAGGLTGALALGSGAGSSLTVGTGATLSGPVTYGGPSLALTVNGTLDNTSATTLNLSSLNVGASGRLNFAVAGATAAELVSTGPATIASGATLGVTLTSVPAGASSIYTVITAPQLTYGGSSSVVAASAPYLFNADFTITPSTATAGGTVTLDLERKSQAETGLVNSEYNSLTPVLNGAAANANLLQAVLTPTTKSSFVAAYDQLLPDHAGGVFLAAQTAAESIGHAALDARAMDFAPGAWVQEFAIGVEEDRNQAVAAHAGGFGVAGGVETGASALGQFGVTAAFANASISNPDVDNDSKASFSELEGGAYWRAAFGGLQLAARAGGGYLFGYDRRFVTLGATDTTSEVSTANKGTWNGWTADGRVSAGYQVDLGKRWWVRPQLVGEYFRLDQDAYTEVGGGPGVDLAVDSRSGDSTTGTASLVFGAKFGHDVVWRPSLEVGARDVFSGDAGDTTARFVSGGDPFTLAPNSITGVGGLVRAGLTVGASFYEVYVDAEGQEFSKYRSGDVRTGVRVLF